MIWASIWTNNNLVLKALASAHLSKKKEMLKPSVNQIYREKIQFGSLIK